MKSFSTLLFVVALSLGISAISSADCRGCCSGHGGVVCKGGVTQCKDGNLLGMTTLFSESVLMLQQLKIKLHSFSRPRSLH